MDWRYANIDWPQTLTAVVALATLVQSAVAVVMMRGLQHSATEARAATASLRLNEQMAERQLRAYVEHELSEIVLGGANDPVKVIVCFKNCGQTRAVDLVGNMKGEFFNTPAEFVNFNVEDDGSRPSKATLGPGNTATFPMEIPRAEWDRELPALKTGDRFIGIVGRVSYRDLFGGARQTEIRRYHDPRLHPTRLVGWEDGNSAD